MSKKSSPDKHAEIEVRQAKPADALAIIQLYHEIYEGRYPDPRMTEFSTMQGLLASDEYCWMVAAGRREGEIVGSVVYQIDAPNLLAKVFGAVVRPTYRGGHLTEKLMTQGLEKLKARAQAIEVVYATTRTLDPAPQKLTARLGYRKLGIFPNIHRTDDYETHALTALFTPDSFKRRFMGFSLHPKLAELFEIVRSECGLPDQPLAQLPPMAGAGAAQGAAIAQHFELETIAAEKFVRHRFLDENPTVREHHWFFPFLEPNLLLTTPDQQIEVFAYHSVVDNYCAIIGIRDAAGVGYGTIFEETCRKLRERGARYIEFIIRADELAKIEIALASQFVPCAYFPSMQLSAAGNRFDYVVFSRSYEILDFRKLKLEGLNRQYLIQYFNRWKQVSLDPILIRE